MMRTMADFTANARRTGVLFTVIILMAVWASAKPCTLVTMSQPNTHGHQSTKNTANMASAVARVKEMLLPGLSMRSLGEPMRVNPLTKHRIFNDIPLLPQGVRAGWVQIPGQRRFAIGLFEDARNFRMLAVADDAGNVVSVPQIGQGTLLSSLSTIDPLVHMSFNRETETSANGMTSIHGTIVLHTAQNSPLVLGAWQRDHGAYSLSAMRTPLPEALRSQLSFRDMVTLGYCAAYWIPNSVHALTPYGFETMMRRLQTEAPMSAIRHGMHDTRQAMEQGLQVSGLEQYAIRLMQEAGVDGDIPSLQAQHGVEPLQLVQAQYAHTLFFGWNRSLPFDAALTAMRMEGNVNRLSQVWDRLRDNERQSFTPIESQASQAQVAAIDDALLRNPALSAFSHSLPAGPVDDWTAVASFVELARDTARQLAQGREGEWSARQAMAMLTRSMRVPFRYDCDFRMDTTRGRAALAFTAASPSLMPHSHYDAQTNTWVEVDEAHQARFSADYNMRLGIMFAALLFGVHENIDEVTIRIDSIGIEEAMAQQDQAIKDVMNRTLRMFESMPMESSDFSFDKPLHKDSGNRPDSLRIMSEENEYDTSAFSDDDFERLLKGADLDEVSFTSSDSRGDSEEIDEPEQGSSDQMNDDPMAALSTPPNITTLGTVTFTRDALLQRLQEDGLEHPRETYSMFQASLQFDDQGACIAQDILVKLDDAYYSPRLAAQVPEHSLEPLTMPLAQAFGSQDTLGLAIQRDSVLEHAVDYFHTLAQDETIASVDKAQLAMRTIQRISDPELSAQSSLITAALIDGVDTPDLRFEAAQRLDDARVQARDQLFSGQMDQSLDTISHAVQELDALFQEGEGVPRFFNSYTDRVLYNKLFAVPEEHTVLIPDNLFYAHIELADALTQFQQPARALEHLNMLVAYAPSYSVAHIKLAAYYAQQEDWDSARAVSLNALRVAFNNTDAAWAYRYIAQAAWMHDEFALAVAAGMLAEAIAPNMIPHLSEELREYQARARSQAIEVPHSPLQAMQILMAHDIPIWPHTEASSIIQQAARVGIDAGLFIPARTLAVAAARLNEGLDPVQIQFLRSLSD